MSYNKNQVERLFNYMVDIYIPKHDQSQVYFNAKDVCKLLPRVMKLYVPKNCKFKFKELERSEPPQTIDKNCKIQKEKEKENNIQGSVLSLYGGVNQNSMYINLKGLKYLFRKNFLKDSTIEDIFVEELFKIKYEIVKHPWTDEDIEDVGQRLIYRDFMTMQDDIDTIQEIEIEFEEVACDNITFEL